MSDSLLTKLSELGLKAVNWAEMTTTQLLAFIEKEAPLLLDEWIRWNFYRSLILWAACLLAIIIVPISLNFVNKKFDLDGIPNLFNLFLCFPIAGLFIFIDWLQILIAPRVWILENIKTLF